MHMTICSLARFSALNHPDRHSLACLSILRGLVDELALASLMADPKTKSLFENLASPEFRVLMLKNFGSKFSSEQCQKKVAFCFSPLPTP